MIFFSVSALEKAPVNKSGELPAEFLDLAGDDQYTAGGPGSYDLTAQLISGGVLVSGRASAPVDAICGRCLQPAEIALETDDLQLFIELGDEEIVDITEDIRAELLINLPANLLCSDDCAGLCPVCGANKNTTNCDCVIEEDDFEAPDSDEPSPWDALDKLKFDK